MLSEIVILGGLLWSYCSVGCQQKEVLKTCESIEKQLKNCESCLKAPGPQPVCHMQKSEELDEDAKNQMKEELDTKEHHFRHNPGKITNNSFFNFMRDLRRHNHNLTAEEAALLWSQFSKADKMHFQLAEYRRRMEELEAQSKDQDEFF